MRPVKIHYFHKLILGRACFMDIMRIVFGNGIMSLVSGNTCAFLPRASVVYNELELFTTADY